MYFETTEEAKVYGIKTLNEAATGLLETADLVGDVFEDGKVNFDDIAQMLRLNSIWEKLKNAPEALKEALDLTEGEIEELKVSITAKAEELKVDGNVKIETIVERVLTATLAIVKLLAAFRKD